MGGGRGFEFALAISILTLAITCEHPSSHTRERRRAKRSGGKESGEEVRSISPTLVLQQEPQSEYLEQASSSNRYFPALTVFVFLSN